MSEQTDQTKHDHDWVVMLVYFIYSFATAGFIMNLVALVIGAYDVAVAGGVTVLTLLEAGKQIVKCVNYFCDRR